MAIYIQIDITDEVYEIQRNLDGMILDHTDNFEEELIAIRKGEPIKRFGNLDLDSWDEGVVYRNFMYILCNYSKEVDYRIYDAAIEHCFSNVPTFQKFIEAIICGVRECDLKKIRDRKEGRKILDDKLDSFGHGMYNQMEVFREHWPSVFEKLKTP